MKFLCLACNRPMDLESESDADTDPNRLADSDTDADLDLDLDLDRPPPAAGEHVVARYTCPQCRCRIAMLTNPLETRFVESLGEREALAGEAMAAPGCKPPARPQWTPQGRDRLHKVPRFVRAMVRKIYTDWAAERGIEEITPAVMDAARSDLGLEGM